MKRIITASLFLIIACKEQKKEKVSEDKAQPIEKVIAESKPDESEDAKKWVKNSIEHFFKTDLSDYEKAMAAITTKEYYEYKTDATNVDMDTDGSLTDKEFQQKWKNKFNTQKAGIGSGFLISGQDWNEIKVTKCKLISQDKNSFLFDVNLTDKEFKAEYPIQVKVIKEKESFLIADVLEQESN